jgi:hypothetical protein
VQIEVSLEVEVQTSMGLDEVESLIIEAGRQAMRKAVAAVCRELGEMVERCIDCGSAELRVDGGETRVVMCSFGKVELRLRRVRCGSCGRGFRPAEAFLACLGGANLTGELRALAVLAGSSWPYETGARVLARLSGACISAESVRQLTGRAGEDEAKVQLEEAERVVGPDWQEAKAQSTAELGAEAAAVPKPKILLVGLDGGWVASRDQPGGMEGKVGVVSTEANPIGKAGRHRLSTRRYVATFRNSEEIGTLTYAAAAALGGESAPVKVVLGDGASWIKTQSAQHFPEAITILDWAHLARYVHRAIRAAKPGPKARELRAQYHRSVTETLWHGQIDEALAQLANLRTDPTEEPIKPLEDTISYLHNHRAWIGNYEAWSEQGYPIGSGMVEREVEIVINRRLKRQGMRWLRSNANALVALRTRTINSDWPNQPTLSNAA